MYPALFSRLLLSFHNYFLSLFRLFFIGFFSRIFSDFLFCLYLLVSPRFLFKGKAESGSEYKSVVIARLLNSKWRRESIVRIVALCKDLDLKETEEKKLVGYE